jgi:RecA-family ATPase
MTGGAWDDFIARTSAESEADAEVARQRQANGHDASLSLDEWDAGDDDAAIPPRGWLLGNVLCRRFVSSLVADGGVGKTAVRIAQCLSLATERPLTGEHVFQRCRVLLISLEDDRDELRRRVEAARLHHGVL